MPCKVIITRDFDHLSEVAARFIQERIKQHLAQHGQFNLGLATGSSPTGVYKHLAKTFNRGELDATQVRSFNLDEYIGLPGANAQMRALHPESYCFFMVQELFGLLRRKFSCTQVPCGNLVDPARLTRELQAHPDDWTEQGADKGKAVVIRPDARSEYLRWVRAEILDAYARDIQQAGGIDLHIIGVGGRGHVAFHECGIPFENNRMLLVRLDDNTIANAVTDAHFKCQEDTPRHAVSMGAELVYEARCVVLLASGARKAEPVATSLAEDPSPAVPCSYSQIYAQRGGNMVYVLDQAAAADVLTRRAEIEQRGIVIEARSDESASCRLADLTFSRDPQTGLMG